MLVQTLVAARNKLVQMSTELSNQIRGLMKTFGLIVPSARGGSFEAQVQRLLSGDEGLAQIILPLLEAWQAVRTRAAKLRRQLLAGARQSHACRQLMAIPGIGAITATSIVTAVEDPGNFKSSRTVAAWFGLTTRRYNRAKSI